MTFLALDVASRQFSELTMKQGGRLASLLEVPFQADDYAADGEVGDHLGRDEPRRFLGIRAPEIYGSGAMIDDVLEHGRAAADDVHYFLIRASRMAFKSSVERLCCCFVSKCSQTSSMRS